MADLLEQLYAFGGVFMRFPNVLLVQGNVR